MSTYAISIKPVTTADERKIIHEIRNEVFVEGQNVPIEIERDEYDDKASTWHLLAHLNGEPVGTVRVVFQGNGVAKIGRLAVREVARSTGVGRMLMQMVLEDLPAENITQAVLSAQTYLENFYQSLGFKSVGDRYQEAGIEHVRMEKNLQKVTTHAA